LEALLELGVDRVLTSGGAPTAMEGASRIAELVRRVGDRMIVMAGGSISPMNAGEIVVTSGVREVHVRGAAPVDSAMRHRRSLVSLSKVGASDYERVVTRADEIRRVVARVGTRD
jgi:copper homeostasis protein